LPIASDEAPEAAAVTEGEVAVLVLAEPLHDGGREVDVVERALVRGRIEIHGWLLRGAAEDPSTP
jgi:hypothetical protein